MALGGSINSFTKRIHLINSFSNINSGDKTLFKNQDGGNQTEDCIINSDYTLGLCKSPSLCKCKID